MKRCNVGGQAVLEGVMMKNETKVAVAVRKSNQSIEIDKMTDKSWLREKNIHKIPFVRGSFILFETMVQGIKCLNFSAKFFEDSSNESIEESKFEGFINKVFKDKADDILIYISMIIALFASIFLFILTPTFIGGLIKHFTDNVFVLNIVEGIIRILIFILYIYIVSLNKDIKRVFEYHGAEHKVIYCYESGEDVTVENAKKYSTIHPRCGTNFMFIVMIVSMILFSLFGWPNPIVRVLSRIICLPIVAGISYEIVKLAGKYDNKFMKFCVLPGLLLQKLTTKQPDEKQLEVAIAALMAVVKEDSEYDN